MIYRKEMLKLFLILLSIIETVYSSVAVRVFVKDEKGTNETNISRPRIYIQNIGTEAVSNFYYYYYFKVDNTKTPVLDSYYVPNCAVTLENKGNGIYRIKFLYNSVALQPGQILPNQSGNCIGLHYPDWSTFSYAGHSYINNSTFVLDENIPVYLSNGTLISGNEITNPQNPPQPPAVSISSGSYAVLSKTYSDIRDSVQIKGGSVGSGHFVEIGCDALVNGSVLSGGNLFLRERASIKGDLIVSSDSIIRQSTYTISGTIRQHAQIDFPFSEYPSTTFGSSDINVAVDSTYNLTPGDYRDFHAYANSIIYVWPGSYRFRTFLTELDVKIILKSSGQQTKIEVNDKFSIADRVKMSFESGIPYPLSVQILSAQTIPLS